MTDTYANCLFAGYTRPVKTVREQAIERLEMVAAQMTDEEFQTWLADIATTAASVSDLYMAATSWLNEDDNYQPHNSDIPY